MGRRAAARPPIFVRAKAQGVYGPDDVLPIKRDVSLARISTAARRASEG
jgi:hypothetical protein